LLTDNQVKEHLSLAFVHAISARIGCLFEATSTDMDSVDAKLSLKVSGPEVRFQTAELHIQLKATIVEPIPDGDFITYPLKIKNYDDLRKQCMVPRILVLLALPADATQWLESDTERLILRRCAFWASPARWAPTTNTTSVTIEIPRGNVFDCATARRFLEQIAREEEVA